MQFTDKEQEVPTHFALCKMYPNIWPQYPDYTNHIYKYKIQTGI